MSREPLRVYFGHHRCASTWIHTITGQLCRRMGLKFVRVHHPDMFDRDLHGYVTRGGIDFLAYTNADIQYVRGLGDFVGFHVIRDPRDIVVSSYFSHLYSHPTKDWPELTEHRARLQEVSIEEGLVLEMDFRGKEFNELFTWDYTQPNVLEIRMEDLIRTPYETTVDAFSFVRMLSDREFGLRAMAPLLLARAVNKLHTKTRGVFPFRIKTQRLPLQEVLAVLYANRFSVKAGGRKTGEEDNRNHYRKGQAGDWLNYFTDQHRDYFKKNYNELLIKLGYETSPDW